MDKTEIIKTETGRTEITTKTETDKTEIIKTETGRTEITDRTETDKIEVMITEETKIMQKAQQHQQQLMIKKQKQ